MSGPPASSPQPSDGTQTLTDAALCDEVRNGEAWPLGELWARHHGLALAWALKKDSSLGEDVVAASFDLVFQALLRGGGPTESFKPYLFRTMNAEFGRLWKSRQRNEPLTDPEWEDPDFVGADARVESAEQRGAAAQALHSLPERWQQVIVAVDVEGRSVQEVAASLGLTPNSASVLLKRAREGLRKAWLRVMHPARSLPEECARSVSQFGELRWGTKDTPARLDARSHIAGCVHCDLRWVQFKDQAVLVGLVSAGILALGSGAHRRVTVPAAATVGVAALALGATALVAPLFGLDLLSSPSSSGEQSSATALDAAPAPGPGAGSKPAPAGSEPPAQPEPSSAASASASSQADGTGVRAADGSTGSHDATAHSTGAASGAASSEASHTGANDARASSSASSDADGTAGPESSSVLYFGDWSDWCESSQSFSGPC